MQVNPDMFFQFVWPAVGPARLFAVVSPDVTHSWSDGAPSRREKVALKAMGWWYPGDDVPAGWRLVPNDQFVDGWIVSAVELWMRELETGSVH